jgi:hypothetical protein
MNSQNSGRKNGNSRQGCRCRQCDACIDNARWERIFQEKFADPLYYSKKQGRNTSPLVDL